MKVIRVAVITTINGIVTREDEPAAIIAEASNCAINYLGGEDVPLFCSPEMEILLQQAGVEEYTVFQNNEELPDSGAFLANGKLFSKVLQKADAICNIFLGIVSAPVPGEELFTKIDESVTPYIQNNFTLMDQQSTDVFFENESNKVSVNVRAISSARKEENETK